MLSLRIALRYLSAARSHKAVSVISVVAVAGVAVATMAIVVVLSVFNGFSELSRRHLARIDPDLKVVPAQGKVFAGSDSLAALLEGRPEVAMAMPTLEERALAVAGSRQMAVRLKGVVPDDYPAAVPFDSTVIDGVFNPVMPEEGLEAAVFSVGTAMELELRPAFAPTVELYVPRRRGRINPANPSAAYRQSPVIMTGVFAVEQPEYDSDYIVADIALLRRMLDYDSGEASALELRLAPGTDAAATADELGALLGSGFRVLDRERQQPETFRMIAVEKWVTFMMLTFILVVACFNIITTISLMVIEKRSDMGTLRAMGASRSTVGAVFAWEGALITLVGGVVGIAVGLLLAWLQQHFGLIRLGADPTALTIDVYPVHIECADIVAVAATVVAVSVAMSFVSRLFTRKIR